MTPRRERLVRTHVVTGGRAHPTRNTLDLVTLVHGNTSGAGVLTPEQRRVVDLCQGGSLSVAEVAAHLALPAAVTKVLLSDLIDSGHVIAYAPPPPTQGPSIELLQEVLDGLRAHL